jgi:hypothetical protein
VVNALPSIERFEETAKTAKAAKTAKRESMTPATPGLRAWSQSETPAQRGMNAKG